MGIAEIAIIVALILSIVLHEVAHGYAANWLGDPTARLAGRLSPNPIRHIDPLGSVIVPAFLFISHSPLMFGWAKPVPYNPYNLNNQRYGDAVVAAAGPGANVLLAVIFSALIRAADVFNFSESFIAFASHIIFLNLLLAIFNALPVPPLDGSKILTAFLPGALRIRYDSYIATAERSGIFFLFALLFISMYFIGKYIYIAALTASTLLTGLPVGHFLSVF